MSHLTHIPRPRRFARRTRRRIAPASLRPTEVSKWPMPLGEALAIGLGCDNYKRQG